MCVYIRDYLTSFEVSVVSGEASENEQIWVGVKIKDDSILVGCMYRPPWSNALVTTNVLNSIKKANEKVEKG